MRLGSWLLVGVGIVFLGLGFWMGLNTQTHPAQYGGLTTGLMVGGAIMLTAGIGLLSCGWGCGYGGYCGYGGGCECGHCDGCSKGDCCGNCKCVESDEGHEGHSHGPGETHSH